MTPPPQPPRRDPDEVPPTQAAGPGSGAARSSAVPETFRSGAPADGSSPAPAGGTRRAGGTPAAPGARAKRPQGEPAAHRPEQPERGTKRRSVAPATAPKSPPANPAAARPDRPERATPGTPHPTDQHGRRNRPVDPATPPRSHPENPGADEPAAEPAAAERADPAPAASAQPSASPARDADPREPRRSGAGVGSRGVRRAVPLDPDEQGRLLAGTHHDPHALLGAHPTRGGITVRVLRPFARSVVVVGEGLRAELHSEGEGLFAGVLPLPEVPDYRLLVTYGTGQDTTTLELGDPYRFLPALGELDLHLISEGRHEQLWRALGAHLMTHQGVTGTRFTVWAPNARGVRLAGDFNYWDGTGLPMRSLGRSGVWELFVPGMGEGTRYKFEIIRPDGSRSLRADPMARRTQCPPDTASVVTASHHRWGDADWLAHRGDRPIHEAPCSVYEVHLPSWRPGLGYRELAEQLPAYVKDLGFTHVELMPVAEHPYSPSWGYQVTSYYAPTARLGTPDDFKYLVDACHQAGIGVIVDWVPAHFPKDDWALAAFDSDHLYEHGDPRRAEHPDWGTLEFDYGRTEVRNFLVANAVYWCEEFHIDGLRVDAVASMLYLDYSREDGDWSPNVYGGRENLDAVAFLQEMNATVYRRCPGVVTIAEESTAWDGVTRPTDGGGLGFGLKWNMGWMHDSLIYISKDPVHRKYHHNEMTFSMVYAYSENYVLPISHDEVVHGKQALVSKMPGDWWQRRANHRAYLAYMWSHPGKQLLFMGQEFAQGAEWSAEHGPEWWLLDETYHSAGDHRGVRNLVRDLNRGYTATPALWQQDSRPEGFTWIDGNAYEDNVFSFVRYAADGAPLVCVSNFSPVVRHDYRLGVPDLPRDSAGTWKEILNTDSVCYGGSGVGNAEPLKAETIPYHGRASSIAPVLPPLATIWLVPA